MTDLADALRPIIRELVAEAMAEHSRTTDTPDRLYDLPTAAEMLGIGRTALYEELGRPGRLRSVRVGRSRRIAASDLADYIARLKAERGQ